MLSVKCLVIGLDGGTWKILRPLMDKGKLPNITSLVEEGCWGTLISSIPPVTFPAWKCYSTGKNPGKIGIYWFIGVDVENKRIIINTSRSVKSKEIWDYLSQQGITCGIVGLPGMYPPKKIRGFIVCEDAPDLTNFTYPRFIGRILKKKFGFKLFPEHAFEADPKKYAEEVKELIRQRFKVSIYLSQIFKPRFLNLTIYHTDGIQHHFWKAMREGHREYGKVIEEVWKIVDEEIGKLLSMINEEAYVMIISDHGFAEAKSIFQLARWLMDRGYLVLRRQGAHTLLRKLLRKMPISRDDIFTLVQKSRILALLRRISSPELRSKIFNRLFPPEGDMVVRNPLEGLIDWERSKTIPVPQGLIYINRNIFNSKEEVKTFRDRLAEEIREIRNPVSGDYLAKRVYTKDELYSGKYLDKAPDIIILPSEGFEIACSALTERLWNEPKKWTGVHAIEGIFIMRGPGVKKGVKVEKISILDLAPTILHLFNIPIPQDMDGKVLKGIFNEEFKRSSHEK